MHDIPDDIYTEPESSPDTLANLGPLRRLAGVWESDQGVDINPKADGPERRVFREHILMEPIDSQANGPQLLYGLRYHIHINTPEEKITFHDQVGYWLWEPATGLVMQTLAIPRGQIAMAAGHAIDFYSALTAFIHAAASNLVSAAQRLVPLGQTDAQIIFEGLRPAVSATVARAAALEDGDPFDALGGACLLADLASILHETQYTRLFRT